MTLSRRLSTFAEWHIRLVPLPLSQCNGTVLLPFRPDFFSTRAPLLASHRASKTSISTVPVRSYRTTYSPLRSVSYLASVLVRMPNENVMSHLAR